MVATDPLSEFNFVLEFNLPKEISDNQEHIKLSVHHVSVPIVEIPVCPIGYNPRPIRMPGETHCIECYKYIKDVLPLINRWVNIVWNTCNKLHSSRSDLYVDARLYGYKDGRLVTSWSLHELYPTLFPTITIKYKNQVELQFGFADSK